mmetsp:Transcript_13029/g.37507  ORF Transcript_13029/g.37507 Transcript_13029/m.37507 type:complete len:223 (-) Transcript_13029:698-1366(-)
MRKRHKRRSARNTRNNARQRNMLGPGTTKDADSHIAQPIAMTESAHTLYPSCHQSLTRRSAHKRTSISTKDMTVHAAWTTRNGHGVSKTLFFIRFAVWYAVTTKSRTTMPSTKLRKAFLNLMPNSLSVGGSLRWIKTSGLVSKPPMSFHWSRCSMSWSALKNLKMMEARRRFQGAGSLTNAQNTSCQRSSDMPSGAVASKIKSSDLLTSCALVVLLSTTVAL